MFLFESLTSSSKRPHIPSQVILANSSLQGAKVRITQYTENVDFQISIVCKLRLRPKG